MASMLLVAILIVSAFAAMILGDLGLSVVLVIGLAFMFGLLDDDDQDDWDE